MALRKRPLVPALAAKHAQRPVVPGVPVADPNVPDVSAVPDTPVSWAKTGAEASNTSANDVISFFMFSSNLLLEENRQETS